MHGRPITLPLLISFIYHLHYNIISLTGLKVTLPLCLLLSYLHNRIPCMHNAWVTDNLTLLDMPFLFIIVSQTSPNITLELLFSMFLFLKWRFIFILRETGLAKTGAAGPFPPDLY